MAKIVALAIVALAAVAAADARPLDLEHTSFDMSKVASWWCHQFCYDDPDASNCTQSIAKVKGLESQLQEASAMTAYPFMEACSRAACGVIVRYAFPDLNGLTSKQNHDAYIAARRTPKLVDILTASNLTVLVPEGVPEDGACISLPWPKA